MAVRTWPVSVSLRSVDRRTVAAALLAAVAAALVLVITQPPDRVPVLVAGSDIPAGAVLGEADLVVRYVESAEGLVEGTGVGELESWSLVIPLNEGEPLLASVVQRPEQVAAPSLIALSLDLEHAVLGLLAAGDLVDVYATVDASIQSDAASTTLVAEDVFVVQASVSEDPARRGRVDVLLAVDDDLAMVLAGANRAGSLDLVKVG